MNFCSNCGKQNDNYKFCPNCGNDLVENGGDLTLESIPNFEESNTQQTPKSTINKTPTSIKQINYTSQYTNSKTKFSSIIGWIFFVMIVIVLAVTNPNKELHVLELKGILKKYVSEKITSAPIDFFGLGSILEGLGNIVIDTQIDELIERKNYLIFSLTYLKYENKEEIIGYGVLGNVFIFDSVKKLISEKFNENSKVQTPASDINEPSQLKEQFDTSILENTTTDEEIISDTSMLKND